MTTTWDITRTDDRGSEFEAISHLWSITVEGDRVAELWVDTDTHEILSIWTAEDHREQGMATALYRAASSEMTIFHAPETHRFDDGARFVERVGGPEMPACSTCCAHLYEDGDY